MFLNPPGVVVVCGAKALQVIYPYINAVMLLLRRSDLFFLHEYQGSHKIKADVTIRSSVTSRVAELLMFPGDPATRI